MYMLEPLPQNAASQMQRKLRLTKYDSRGMYNCGFGLIFVQTSFHETACSHMHVNTTPHKRSDSRKKAFIDQVTTLAEENILHSLGRMTQTKKIPCKRLSITAQYV